MLSGQVVLKAEVAAGKVDGLRSQVTGQVIAPGDPHYDERRKAWNLRVDQHPSLILIAQEAQDVVSAVRFANEQGLGIAVQSGGHGVIRPADGALLVITSDLCDLQVDAGARTARLGAGLKWGVVLEETQAVGLAPLLGSSPDVGVVGYTLGGGFGWLGRRYGLAVDSVLSIDIVTADGQLRHASQTENADLFWGLRGGGGAFGVVTGMEIKLYPVERVYAGNLIYPIELAKEVYIRYREWIKSAPDELTSSIVIMNFPPIPQIPEFLRGKTFVMVRGCFCGSFDKGEALLRHWRDWQAPFLDDFKAISFAEVATVSNDPVDPLPGFMTGAWLSELSDDVINILIQYGAAKDGPSPLVVTEVRHTGGAIARVDPQANAYGHRDAELILNLIGMTPTPEAFQHLVAYTEEFKRLLQPHMTGGVYMNFLEGEESRQRIQDAYSAEAYQRLVALKAKYDPDNLFSYSFNIQP